jgi:hypothetical protein
MTGRSCRAAGTGMEDAAGRFLAWLADDASLALTRIIRAWLWLPASSGGPGALRASAWDVAQLRAGVLAAWAQVPGTVAAQGRRAR